MSDKPETTGYVEPSEEEHHVLTPEEKAMLAAAKPYGGRTKLHTRRTKFLTPEEAVLEASSKERGEDYEDPRTIPRTGDPHSGVLRDRDAIPLPVSNSPQTLAEKALPASERGIHYSAGMTTTPCMVFMPAKETTNRAKVTCPDCIRWLKRTKG